jgi:hypothetical protein
MMKNIGGGQYIDHDYGLGVRTVGRPVHEIERGDTSLAGKLIKLNAGRTT